MSTAVRIASRARTTSLALVGDLVFLLVFAALGRRSHAEGVTAAGVVSTALPFAAGAAAGWAGSRGWRAPMAVVRTGVPVWGACVAGGMLLRRASGQGTASSFVVVTAVVLGIFLLGWRVVAHYADRRVENARRTGSDAR